jgi:hypothetical protein
MRRLQPELASDAHATSAAHLLFLPRTGVSTRLGPKVGGFSRESDPAHGAAMHDMVRRPTAAMAILRKRTVLVLPAVLLSVNLLEYIATYKARQHVHDIRLRAAIAVALYGVAFAVAAEYVSPWLRRVLTATRRDSHRHGGTLGLLLFYVCVYGALYYAYFVVEKRGPAALLPPSLR